MGISRIIIKKSDEEEINFDFDFTKSNVIKVDWDPKYYRAEMIPEFKYLRRILSLLRYANGAFEEVLLRNVFVEIYYNNMKYQFSLNERGKFFHEALFKIETSGPRLLRLYPLDDSDITVSESWTFRKISDHTTNSILENIVYIDDYARLGSYNRLSDESIERIKKLIVYFGFDDIDDVVFHDGYFSHLHHKAGRLSFEEESHGLKDLIRLLICIEGYDTIITPYLGYFHPNLRACVEEYLEKSGKHIIYTKQL